MGPAPMANVVEGLVRGSATDKLTYMVRNLPIAQTREMVGMLLKIGEPRTYKDASGVMTQTTILQGNHHEKLIRSSLS